MERQKTLYDVAAIGNYTKDTIITPDRTRQIDGGGFRYAAHAAARLGCKVAAITRLAAADSHVLDALQEAGIDVYACETPESTHICLDYPTDDVDQRILTVSSTAGSFTPVQIQGVDAKAFVVSASIRGEVPLEVIRELGCKNTTITLDAQGFIRVAAPDGRLEHREWWEKRAVLSQVHILKADAVEARFLTGEADIETAAKILADLGPSEIIISHSEGLLVFAEGEIHQAPFHAKSLVGRSGRGDTCVGSYVARRLTSPPAEATVWAAAVASLKMEQEGPFSGSIDDVVDLLERKYGVAHCA